MINYKILLKAISFMFLPTLSVLFVVFIGFFSFEKFITFITSSDSWAIFLRVILIVLEIAFIVTMYFHYLREEAFKNATNIDKKVKIINERSHGGSEYHYFRDGKRNYVFTSYETEDSDIIILKRTKTDNY